MERRIRASKYVYIYYNFECVLKIVLNFIAGLKRHDCTLVENWFSAIFVHRELISTSYLFSLLRSRQQSHLNTVLIFHYVRSVKEINYPSSTLRHYYNVLRVLQ